MTRKIYVMVICLCLFLSGLAYSEHAYTTRLQDFVANVYDDYGAQSFDAVYAVMYPSIAERVTEGEYAEFQQHHFTRLSLELSDIEVGEVSEGPRLTRSLRQLLPDDEDLPVYGVEITYRAHFVSGVQRNQRISKTVYVALVDPGTAGESLYLLWDPSSMEEEETDQ
ncbi:MAG TPA: hypothetical protein VJZ70_04020 [Limnochordia bacterium]|nr:hypothetical protein [Limnochordia bacterium]